jgi:hypothetical protein
MAVDRAPKPQVSFVRRLRPLGAHMVNVIVAGESHVRRLTCKVQAHAFIEFSGPPFRQLYRCFEVDGFINFPETPEVVLVIDESAGDLRSNAGCGASKADMEPGAQALKVGVVADFKLRSVGLGINACAHPWNLLRLSAGLVFSSTAEHSIAPSTMESGA